MNPNTESKHSRTERVALHAYQRELFASIAVYTALLWPSLTYGPAMSPGPMRTIVLVAPIVGFFLMIWAIGRHIRRMDEYQRSLTLQTFSLAAAVTAGVTFTYGFLENAGFPRLSMFMVWGVMGCAWLLIGLFRCSARRLARG